MAKFKPQFQRIVLIDRLLKLRKYPNCTSIARTHEVSSRTISRDIEYMKDMLEAPIEYDTKRRGYYYTEPNFHLPVLELKESDLFALCIAEKALEQYENTPIYGQLKSIFDKLKAQLPDTILVKTTWIDMRYTFLTDSSRIINPEIWETISIGLHSSRKLRILHRKVGSEIAVERTVNPYHLTNYKGEWYLVAYCNKRRSVVQFAVSRIEVATLTDIVFEIPSDFSLDDFLGSSFGIITEDKEYHVEIQFTKEQSPYVEERIWHPTQEIKKNIDGTIVLSFLTNSLFEVKRWALGWGGDAKVLSPFELAEQVRKELKKALSYYNKS